MGKFIDRTGEKRMMNCGLEATIIAYRGTSDIDIEFSDGVIVSNRFYQCFKNGLIRYPIKSRLGEKRMMKCGMEATIIAYRNSHDIDIEFSDGSRRYGIRYKKFQEGVTLPEKKWVCGFNSRVGEKRMMNCGLEAEIIAYRCCSDIDIKFSDGTVRTRKAYDSFRKGTIAYPLIQRNYSGTLSSFTLEKLAYKHNDSVYYFCECQKCKLRDILTPQEILKHECEVINSE